MNATILFLPAHVDQPWRWLRVENDAVTGRGEGAPEAGADPTIAIAPADAVTLHWSSLPARSPAQAQAAARIVIAEASAAPLDGLHVAVGDEAEDERPIGVVANGRMRDWLGTLASLGIDPAVILPAPLLLPAPAEGYVRAELGGQSVVRGRTSGFADEARITDLVTGGSSPETLGRDAVEAAIVANVAQPLLNLRQGPFARRKRRAIDWPLIRRLAVLAGMILLVTLAIDLTRIARYAMAADAAEAQADALAREGLPRGADQGDAGRLLTERLSRLRGPGAGFSATVAALTSATREVDGTEVIAVAFEPTGELRATIAASGEAQANQLIDRLREAGFAVAASTFQSDGQRVRGDVTVALP
ncbi:type II secretion system protein L (GspL) [Sphingomonas sp. OV641]|uniref:type II secretion system protein GspL n=1 Tax=Sphingomonas sp. OV641 TaxID=1881068 RepID=UPI0008C77E47|nr:type II secretion system protein GspL [Sphingomonas sp. OV641]SEI74634.1 type II secretion system protein L (GspL) [Sphingomonas sp. OV641]